MFGVFLFLTYYLTGILHFGAMAAGTAFLPLVATMMTSATLAGSRLVTRFGPRPVIPMGAATAALGLTLFTNLDTNSGYPTDILPALVLLGIGMGLIYAPIQNAATGGVRPQDVGVASALISTVQQVGGSIGTALLSSVASAAARAQLVGRPPTAANRTLAALHSYHVVFGYSAGFLAASAVVAAVMFRNGPIGTATDADPPRLH